MDHGATRKPCAKETPRASACTPPSDSQWEGALGAQKEKEEYRLCSLPPLPKQAHRVYRSARKQAAQANQGLVKVALQGCRFMAHVSARGRCMMVCSRAHAERPVRITPRARPVTRKLFGCGGRGPGFVATRVCAVKRVCLSVFW